MRPGGEGALSRLFGSSRGTPPGAPRRTTPGQRLALLVVAAGLGWLAWDNGMLDRTSLLLFAVLVPSIILHEVSHGAVALAFGDPTAREAGRLTLNPVPHIDPFGTVLLPALLVLSGAPAFGYAKPVPVRPARMRDPRNHALLVSLAGPATNVVLCLIAAGVFVGLRSQFYSGVTAFQGLTLAGEVVILFGLANVALAVFNLIPLPPLDGSAVVERVLPDRWLTPWYRLRQYSMLILLGIFLLAPGLFAGVIDQAVRQWARLLS